MSNLGQAVAALSSTDLFCSTCGHSLTATAPDPLDTVGPDGNEKFQSHQLAPGTLLAERYRIVALIGQGGMGEVYQADDLTLEQPVALKFLPPELQGDRAALARFHREVSLSRKISHPNVCRVFDIGYADGLAFITMEFVGGEDLRALLARIGRLTPDKAIAVAQQLCAGLAAAHDEGVLHHDLKPANIMLDRRGNVRITDFGLAAPVGEAGVARAAGTPVYMAPEQIRGQMVSVQSDLYSLGLVLREIFAGNENYRGLPVIEPIIAQCLEIDAAKRPQTAAEIGAALGVRTNPRSRNISETWGTPATDLFRRHQIGWWVFTTTLLGFVGLLTVTLRTIIFDRVVINSPVVLLTWVWCMGAQALFVFLSIGYLLRYGAGH
ncbi:MAG TPA: serine/threonine-protein kinase [Terriglobales bacterium]|nr:serine/threonine-protein kinase [Terriglobales bacterium]